MSRNWICSSGFTLVEMLLSIALIGILAGLGMPVFSRSQTKTDLDMGVTTWVESLRRASILSSASDGDSTWGVHLETGIVCLFKGSSYASRDTSFDEIFSLSTGVSFSGVTDVVMAKLTGYPQTSGSTTFTSGANDSVTVTINDKGMISY